jgi:hypothetical protein
MKKNLRYLAGAAVGAVVALGFSSCAYDPYYSTSVGGSYSSGGGGRGGYGDGYGYGGSSFSTSLFVGTGNPQWGYDPDCYSYYDYQRRCYYDPYLNGYYPIGYRPQVVYGAPHPYGWYRGCDYIRPPSRVTNVTVVNYRDRESRYRNSSYGWAKQVRRGPGVQDSRSEQNGYQRKNPQNFEARRSEGSRDSYQNRQPQRDNFQARQENGARPSFQSNPPSRQNARPSMQQGSGREQYRYNSPVSSRQPQAIQQGQRVREQNPNNRQQPPQRVKSNKGKNPKDDNNRVQGFR